MTINESELNNLSSRLTSNITTFVTDANNAINAYVAKVNSIWCSPESKNVGKSIGDCLSKADQNIDKNWFSGTKSGINGVLSINVANFNSVEKTNFSWNKVSFQEPQVGNLGSKIELKFSDGHTGTREGAKATELDSPFDSITEAYVNLFKNFISTVDNSNAFSANQKSALKTGFANASNTLTKSMGTLKDQIHETFDKVASYHDELDSTNATNAQGM